ncbi:uncharacterized protein T551_03097 [Pneumocystis jirovecii RU7]|uniref:SGTA homodimerisation domain-containing protein n=1 Tax=Pneumocystis jirovecii (strain RU7) TaxID=1408657 RepID=A0A0W4ZGV7_PNEJ7|nr:uncharacterized protein T551_03097 [Pneumocystis jirovecii RU7]KTW27598.1 hypothetical protein T551_03097 [Pneumocystis jirovecii RU7]
MSKNLSSNQQCIAFLVAEWLENCLKEGIIPEEEKEGIEVAVQCITGTFSVDPCCSNQRKSLGIDSQTLTSIFEEAQQQTRSSVKISAEFATNITTTCNINTNDKAKAEDLKTQGNNAMSKKDYSHAIHCYTEALKLFPHDVIYLSNRAAAYSQSGDNHSAVKDAKLALEIDPSYGKAYSRLGHAYYALGNYKEALEVYEKGLKVDPASEIMKRGLELVKKNVNEQNNITQEKNSEFENVSKASNTDSSNEIPRGTCEMPDFASMMNNSTFMSVAQNLMSSGALNDLLTNPRIAQMAQNIMSSGQAPNIQDIMADPEMRNIARGFMGNFGQGNTGNTGGNVEKPFNSN